MMFLKKLMIGVLFFTTVNIDAQTPLPKPIQHYIKKIHQKYNFQEAQLIALFEKTRINHKIIDQLNHPYEKKPWYHYRKIFITKKRIDLGLQFWKKHKKILDNVEKKYGIPSDIIVAIMGIETYYGERLGQYPVMDTLTTLGFYYPARAKFFKKELTEYLLLTREQDFPPLSVKGSYAGAIGIPQFMPSTYRHYAIGYENKGNADIINRPEDAIISIANYLAKMGWKKSQPVALLLKTKAVPKPLISSSAKLRRRVSYFLKKGVKIPALVNKKQKAAIIALALDKATPNYWLIYTNFRAIMRYNPRINYAMVVYQLSEAIKDEYRRKTTATHTSPSSTKKT